MPPFKKCTKCGEEKPATREFFKRHKKKYLSSHCRKCETAATKQWRSTLKGKEAIKRWTKTYHTSDKGKKARNKAMKKYRNSDKGRESLRKKDAKGRQCLSRQYIKGVLRTCGVAKATNEVIELKRIHMTLKRIRNERKNEQPVNS
jgi:hypothetical protein